MAGLASPGIGSGLDINGLITKLMAVEQQPLVALQQKEASYQAKLSAFGSLQSALSTLQSSTKALALTTTFTNMAATVSDGSVLTAAAGTAAVAGTYTIGVSQLAKNHVLNTLGNYVTDDTFKGGSLAITVGTATTNVTIADGASLDNVRQAVNDAKTGLTATIVNAGPPNNYNRLILTSNATGSSGAISVAVTETGTGGVPAGAGVVRSLTDLAYAGTDTAAIKQAQAADDAVLSINNVTITRSSNSISDAVAGLTLNLTKAGTLLSPLQTQVTVAKNNNATQGAIGAFVSMYNAAINQIRTLSAYDATNNKAAVLTGDGTARSVSSQLTSLAQSVVTGISGNISRLSDIGISVQKDGTLAIDSTKLQAALNDPSKDVTGLFTSTTTGNTGIAVRFNDALNTILDSTSGLIAGRTDGINRSIKDLNKQQDTMQLRLTAIENRYRAQFNALDSLISSMNNTSTYLTQQLTSLSNLTKSITSGN